jgi:hypothetical protein
MHFRRLSAHTHTHAGDDCVGDFRGGGGGQGRRLPALLSDRARHAAVRHGTVKGICYETSNVWHLLNFLFPPCFLRPLVDKVPLCVCMYLSLCASFSPILFSDLLTLSSSSLRLTLKFLNLLPTTTHRHPTPSISLPHPHTPSLSRTPPPPRPSPQSPPMGTAEEPSLLRLRARATECAGEVAVSVGRAAFEPYAEAFFQQAMQGYVLISFSI